MSGLSVTETSTIRGCFDKGELAQVVDLLDRAFANTPREYFERHVLHDPTLRPEDTRVLFRGNRIVSSVQIFSRVMRVAGATIAFGGIGNVATDPAERHSGLATVVMNDAIARMRERRFGFSMLTTTINPYYERFGYRTVVRDIAVLPPILASMQPGVRVFNPSKDLNRVKELYRLYTANSVGPLVRDDIYWQGQFEFCGEDPRKFLVLVEDGIVAGYLRSRVEKGHLELLEFGAEDRCKDKFETLLQSVCSLTPGIPVKLHVSGGERERLQIQHPCAISEDRELMILPLDSTMDITIERALMPRNAINFWGSDFF